jgi:hypothetical protein
MNTLHPPGAEDRGKRSLHVKAAAPVERVPRPFRFAMAAQHTCPGPGYYLMLLRECYANDTRLRFYRVFATRA